MRAIVGRHAIGTAAIHTRAVFPDTLAAGGGWTNSPPWVGPRARELSSGVRELQLDLVAEAVCPPAAAADQGGRQLVQLEVVARQPACRHVALEHVAEADEDP